MGGVTALTAQAAHMAELRSENTDLRETNVRLVAEVERLMREVRVMWCMQEIVDAQAAKLASQPVLRQSPRLVAS